MTISAATVWEVRTTGAQTNGGGFANLDPGTSVDYSQQAAAQLSLTNLNHAAGSSILTSATGGFTAAMVGNIIKIVSGTNFTVGWYQIIAYTSSNQVTVDRSLGASAGSSNGVGNVGGAFLIGGAVDDAFFETKVAGNAIYIATGTYTLTSHIDQSVTGSALLPITWIGYKNTRNDITTRTDRPLFVCGSWFSKFGSYTILKNLRFTTTSSDGLLLGNYSVLYNCKSQNTGIATRKAISVGYYSHIIFCEAISDLGIAIFFSYRVSISFCYIHDSVSGLTSDTGNCVLYSSVIAKCTTGLALQDTLWHTIMNNTIYSCTTGISATTAYESIFINNIITNCATGASWGTFTINNIWDYNCWNNTIDVVNITKGPNDITADPKLKDPADDDFTLKGGSPCFAAGLSLSSDVGLS